MNLQSNDFALFGLPETFSQDAAQIDARWKELQREVHPDRFAAQGAAAQRLAMQWSVRINEAYGRLRDPLKRAAYLCEWRGASIAAETNTAMPQDFLLQQMQWHEDLEAAATLPAVDGLAQELRTAREERLLRCATFLDVGGDAAAAAGEVRALMFITRCADELETRRDQLGQ